MRTLPFLRSTGTPGNPGIPGAVVLPALAVAAGALLSVGCASVDRHTFQAPYTHDGIVTVVDTETREEVWRHDVPAGHKLVVDFDRTEGHESVFAAQGLPADELEWSLFPADKKMLLKGFSVGDPIDSGRQDLPGTPVLIVYNLLPKAAEPTEPTPPEMAPQSEAAQPAPATEAQAEPQTGADADAEAAQETVDSMEPAEPTEAPEAQPEPEPTPAPEMTKEGDGAPAAPAAPAEEEAPVLIK